MKTAKGVTLVELLVGMAVGMILLGSIYMAVNVAQRSTSGIERKVTAQQDLKPALDLMAMEIGMAGYNPNYTTGNWAAATTCSGQGTLAYKGIQQATATAITVEMDINENCTGNNNPACMTGNANPNEIITYTYDATNLYITREINCDGNPQPFLGDKAASGRPRTVRVINNTAGTGNTAIPVFRYYNGTGACILEVGEIPTGNCVGNFDATSLPGAIPNIRRIEITLAVETEDIDPNTKQRRRLIYSTSVIPRNHVIIP